MVICAMVVVNTYSTGKVQVFDQVKNSNLFVYPQEVPSQIFFVLAQKTGQKMAKKGSNPKTKCPGWIFF